MSGTNDARAGAPASRSARVPPWWETLSATPATELPFAHFFAEALASLWGRANRTSKAPCWGQDSSMVEAWFSRGEQLGHGRSLRRRRLRL